MDYRRKHSRQHPRSWFSLFLRYGGGVSLVLGLALIFATFISASRLYIADGIDAEGVYARASVFERRSEELVGGGTRYYVTFRYKTASGGQSAEVEVTPEFHASHQVGDEAVIRYRVTQPDFVEEADEGYRRSGVLFRWIGLGFGLAGLLALWRSGRRANRAVLARRDGEKRFAEITGIEELGKGKGRLVWREEDGQTGHSYAHDLAELSRTYHGGDRIVVFRLGTAAYWEGDVGPPRRELR
jgi:hypothetical protein